MAAWQWNLVLWITAHFWACICWVNTINDTCHAMVVWPKTKEQYISKTGNFFSKLIWSEAFVSRILWLFFPPSDGCRVCRIRGIATNTHTAYRHRATLREDGDKVTWFFRVFFYYKLCGFFFALPKSRSRQDTQPSCVENPKKKSGAAIFWE